MQAIEWIDKHIKNLNGKTAVVTGANSGLGFETAKFLSYKGAEVIMACRNLEKADDAAKKILHLYPNAKVNIMQLDLASLQSIKDFSETVNRDKNNLDILCNNAGVMAIPKKKTIDGFEMQFGTNHLGHFALTALLFPLLKNTKNSRVINLSSELHKYGKIDFKNLQGEKYYSKWKAYSQSKLANLLFTYELKRRIENNNISMLSLAAHPGYAATNLQTAASKMTGALFKIKLTNLANFLFAQTQEMGALPTILAAAGDNVQNGDFFGPGGFMGMRGFPEKVQSSSASHNLENAKKLWEVSEQLSGISFEF